MFTLAPSLWVKKLKKCICVFVFACVFVLASCSSSQIGDWHLKYLSVETLWTYSQGNSQTIAFIDTGISDDLKSLYGDRIVDTYNVFDKTHNVNDEHGHGTEMVSLACGDGQNDVWGVAPKAKIIIIKAVDSSGRLEYSTLAKAINYAANSSATIINVSLGGHIINEDVLNAISGAINKGITVVAAAGDYGEKDLLFPASVSGVVSVEAKNKSGNIWDMGNTSDNSVVAMPGENIKELTPNKDSLSIVFDNGTSQATALASGYIALLRDFYSTQHLSFDNKDILDVLKSLNSLQKKDVDFIAPFKKSVA